MTLPFRAMAFIGLMGLIAVGCGEPKQDSKGDTPVAGTPEADAAQNNGGGQLRPEPQEGEETDPSKLVMLMRIGVEGAEPVSFELESAGSEGSLLLLLPRSSASVRVPATASDESSFALVLETKGLHSIVKSKKIVEGYLDTYYTEKGSDEEKLHYAALHDPGNIPWVQTSRPSYGFEYGFRVGGLAKFSAAFAAERNILQQRLTLLIKDSAADDAATIMVTVPVVIEQTATPPQ